MIIIPVYYLKTEKKVAHRATILRKGVSEKTFGNYVKEHNTCHSLKNYILSKQRNNRYMNILPVYDFKTEN